MNVGIIGCGLIGNKRARALAGARLVACADSVATLAEALAQSVPGVHAYADWHKVIDHPTVQIVIVATTNEWLAPVTAAAIAAGKHVLVEKPAARRAAELEPLLAAVERAGVCVRVGFNHRYHPAFLRARELVDGGELGELMFVRGLYGHGGRSGYEREWRANPQMSGGGELLDQGVHLIDLARWFLGDFPHVQGYAHTYFWDMPVDDNGFMLLRTARQQAAFLHASWTEWKNTFSFEIYGRTAKLHVTGLGGSYGVERLAWYQMRPEMGPPDTTIWEYPGSDTSWHHEFAEFLQDIDCRRTPAANLHSAHAALRIVERVVEMSRV